MRKNKDKAFDRGFENGRLAFKLEVIDALMSWSRGFQYMGDESFSQEINRIVKWIIEENSVAFRGFKGGCQ